MIKRVLGLVDDLSYSVSYTTRKMREGEVHGQDYFFVDVAKFGKLIDENEFLEYAEVHGNFYGTSKNQVRNETDEGNDIILEIDVQGAKNVQKQLPQAVGIFILPPSYKILSERLIARRTENDQNLTVRLNNARKEVRQVSDFEYIVVNNDLDIATDNLKSIIIAERLKRDRQIYHIQDILDSFENC